MATTNDLEERPGAQHRWPAVDRRRVPAREARQGSRLVRTKLKNVLSGRSSTRPSTRAPRSRPPTSTSATSSPLPKDGDDFVFMDSSSYDQIHVPDRGRRQRRGMLWRASRRIVATHDGTAALRRAAPASVVLITYTEPGLRATARLAAPSPPRRDRTRSLSPLFIENGTRSRWTPATVPPRPRQLVVSARGKARSKCARRPLRGRLQAASRRSRCSTPRNDDADITVNPFTSELVYGVVEHGDRIDPAA